MGIGSNAGLNFDLENPDATVVAPPIPVRGSVFSGNKEFIKVTVENGKVVRGSNCEKTVYSANPIFITNEDLDAAAKGEDVDLANRTYVASVMSDGAEADFDSQLREKNRVHLRRLTNELCAQTVERQNPMFGQNGTSRRLLKASGDDLSGWKRTCQSCLCHRCTWITLSALAVATVVLIILAVIFWPQDLDKVYLCEFNGCLEGTSPNSVKCGQAIEAAVLETGAINMQIELVVSNPNAFEATVSNLNMTFEWVGEYADAALLEFPHLSAQLGYCIIDSLTLAASSDSPGTAVCTLQINEVLGRALKHFYEGDELSIKQVIDAKARVMLLSVAIKETTVEVQKPDVNFAKASFEVNEDGELVLVHDGMTPPVPLGSSVSPLGPPPDEFVVVGGAKDCGGTSDLPIQEPILLLCGLNPKSVDVFAGEVDFEVEFILVNQMGFTVHIESMDLHFFEVGEVDKLGTGILPEPITAPPNDVIQFMFYVSISDISVAEISRVLSGLNDGTLMLDIDGIVRLTILNMSIVLDTPRVTIPVEAPAVPDSADVIDYLLPDLPDDWDDVLPPNPFAQDSPTMAPTVLTSAPTNLAQHLNDPDCTCLVGCD